MSTARTENADPLRREAGQLRSFRERREEGRPGSLGSSLRIYQRHPPNRPGDLGSLSGHDWGWLYQRAGRLGGGGFSFPLAKQETKHQMDA